MASKGTRAFAGVLILLAALLNVVIAPGTAQASGCDINAALQNFGPDSGTVYAHKLSGGRYSASLSFTLTPAQVKNLQCLGPFVEIDFRLHGSGLGGLWEGYSTFSNMQGAMHDTAVEDMPWDDPNPAVTGIQTAHLEAGSSYFAGISWLQSGAPSSMTVSVHWTPSRGPLSSLEWAFCGGGLAAHAPYQNAYCVFGIQKPDGQDAGFPLSQHYFGGDGHLAFTSIVACYAFGGWTCSGGQDVDSNGNPPSGSAVDAATSSTPMLPPAIDDSSRPSAIQYGSSELSVFQRDADNRVKKDSWNGTSWSGFGDMGGNLRGNPATVQYGNPAELDVFARGSNNEIWKNTWNGSSWSGWNSLGGEMQGSPSAVAYGNELDVFARGSNNEIWKDTWNGSSWSGWNSLGGNMAGNPVAVKYGNELDVFAKGVDGQLYKDTWNGSSWSGFSSLGGTLAGDPSVVAYGSELDVFMRSSVDGYVWKQTWNGSSWSGWNALGGTYAGDPMGVAYGSELDVFVKGTDGALWKDTWNGSSWGGFSSLGGVLVGNPMPVQYNSELDVFVRGTTGAIWKQT